MPLRATFYETIKLLGFRGPSDLLSGAFGLQAYSISVFKYLAGGALLAAVTAFCTRWIWNPPSALFLLLCLDLANHHYGYQVAKKLRGEPFKWKEFQRLGGIILSTIIVMAIVRNAINSYPYYDFLADLIFGWLFATKAQKVVSKMVALKVQEEGAASLFQFALKWLLQSKLGALVVDEVQRREAPANVPEEAPAPPVEEATRPGQTPAT